MQNPEVWSFQTPQTSFTIQEFQNTLPVNKVNRFSFNHLVSVVLPNCLRVPESLLNILSDDCDYYKITDLSLTDILNSNFINNFIKKGKLILLSIGTRIDCDNCCAVTPFGKLILSLTKDTYQSFGLDGKLSHFTKRNKDRYIVEIDLTNKLIQGKPNYDRITTALNSLERFSVIFNWKPPDESICPSSAAKYFDSLKYVVQRCEPRCKTHVVYSIKTPTLEGEYNEDDIVDFAEWLGMVSLDGDFTGSAGDYVNSYEAPEPNVEIGQIRVLVLRGFYQSSDILKLLEVLRAYNTEQDNLWVAAYVQGFSDSPVIEGKEEHHYFTNGDNGNIYIMKKDKFVLCQQRCSAKRYK
ncbi:ribonuclease P protein subunit p40-like isoform X2 [Euwallacea similis]|uniref:ribonuclease P protein subunit p40-like isoform X2 n=1 Tax=Euwallacea similis TaxID=1736056 RepID=UPI0034504925